MGLPGPSEVGVRMGRVGRGDLSCLSVLVLVLFLELCSPEEDMEDRVEGREESPGQVLPKRVPWVFHFALETGSQFIASSVLCAR